MCMTAQIATTATTAGRTASICLSVYVSQHKWEPAFFFSHNSLTFLDGKIFSPLRYLNQCQAFTQSFAIFSLSHSLCFSPRHNLFLRYACPGAKNKIKLKY